MFFKRRVKKIAIIGGCQTPGLAEASRALLPKAHIASWHVGVHPADTPQQILEQIKSFDVVVSQITPGHGLELLQMDNLRKGHANVHFIPTFVCPGFHPDLTYIWGSEGPISAVHSDFHSRIALGAFLLGFTPERTLKLYNALVFAEFGYFEAFPAARIAMEESLRDSGFDINGLVDRWLGEIGPFMYLANHPHVRLLTTLCRDLYVKLGLIPASTPVPVIQKDHLAESFTWPVYPALGKRLGIAGSMDFLRPAWLVEPGQRALPMAQYLRDVFASYEKTDRSILEAPAAIEARDILARLVA